MIKLPTSSGENLLAEAGPAFAKFRAVQPRVSDLCAILRVRAAPPPPAPGAQGAEGKGKSGGGGGGGGRGGGDGWGSAYSSASRLGGHRLDGPGRDV